MTTACVAVVVIGGAGTAWAMRGSSGPEYRLAGAVRADLAETVDADGTLSATGTRVLSFAASGTVQAVRVAVGSTVRAGQTLATLDPDALRSTVTAARQSVARARQQLADDKQAQLTGTTTSASDSGTASSTAGTGSAATSALTTSSYHARLLAAVTPTAATTIADVKRAQAALVAAQHALDTAIGRQDDAVTALSTACASGAESTPESYSTTAGSSATITGTTGAQPAVVTLDDANGSLAQTSASNPQQLSTSYRYTFTGLTAGAAYTVQIVRSAQVKSATCSSAVGAVTSAQQSVDSAAARADAAVSALTAAIGGLSTSPGSGGQPTTQPTSRPTSQPTAQPTAQPTGQPTARPSGMAGAQPTAQPTGASSGRPTSAGGGYSTRGSSSATTSGQAGTTGLGSSSSAAGSTSVAITAQQLVADVKAIDAARAELAVDRAALGNAVLRSPIHGTVASVDLARGDAVSAGSSSSAITVVGKGSLTVDVAITIADIDKVKVGQHAQVTVDGRSEALPATVTTVGLTNSASSTGSSSTYQVTVQLDRKYRTLYDGMGASVAIDVGHVTGAVTVPISAVHTTGSLTTVTVYSGGTATTKRVTVGLVGADRAQITSGLAVGDRVVLAELNAAIPSSDTSTGRGSSLSGLTGTGGGPPSGGFPGGSGARPGG